MNWSEFLRMLLAAFGGAAALLLLLAFLGRSLVKHFLKKDEESFKIGLKKNADRELEQFKHTLLAASMEHQVRFSKLHEKRAEVLAELYALLSVAVQNAELFTSPLIPWEGTPPKDERAKNAIRSIQEFALFFDKHRIYLSAGLGHQIDAFTEQLRRPTEEAAYYFDYFNVEGTPEQLEAQMKAWLSLRGDLKSTRRAIEEEFRRILGDDSAKGNG